MSAERTCIGKQYLIMNKWFATLKKMNKYWATAAHLNCYYQASTCGSQVNTSVGEVKERNYAKHPNFFAVLLKQLRKLGFGRRIMYKRRRGKKLELHSIAQL